MVYDGSSIRVKGQDILQQVKFSLGLKGKPNFGK